MTILHDKTGKEFRVVPAEPTPRMLSAFGSARDIVIQSHLLSGSYPASWTGMEEGYAAMLGAAPLFDPAPTDPRAELIAMITERDRLAREIDAAICGDGERAKQPSLCDLVAPVKALRIGHDRYETARRMNPRAWQAAWEVNTQLGKPFDQIIDDLRPFVARGGR